MALVERDVFVQGAVQRGLGRVPQPPHVHKVGDACVPARVGGGGLQRWGRPLLSCGYSCGARVGGRRADPRGSTGGRGRPRGAARHPRRADGPPHLRAAARVSGRRATPIMGRCCAPSSIDRGLTRPACALTQSERAASTSSLLPPCGETTPSFIRGAAAVWLPAAAGCVKSAPKSAAMQWLVSAARNASTERSRSPRGSHSVRRFIPASAHQRTTRATRTKSSASSTPMMTPTCAGSDACGGHEDTRASTRNQRSRLAHRAAARRAAWKSCRTWMICMCCQDSGHPETVEALSERWRASMAGKRQKQKKIHEDQQKDTRYASAFIFSFVVLRS